MTKNPPDLPRWILDTPHPRWEAALYLRRPDWCKDLVLAGVLLILRSMSGEEQDAFAGWCRANPSEALDRILTAAEQWLDAPEP